MMTGLVSDSAIFGMIFTLLVSVAVPVVAMLVCKKKLPGDWMPVLIGAGTMVVFALILEQIFHTIILKATGDTIAGNIVLYAIYGGAAAGLFEETGRFLSMKFLMKKTLSKQNSVMYGIGHGGLEMIAIGAMGAISNLAVAFLINEKGVSGLMEEVGFEKTEAAMDQLSALWSTAPAMFYLSGVERIAAFVLQICLSYLVYRAVKDKKFLFWVLALLLHFVVDAGAVLLSKNISALLTEGILLVCVLVLGFFSYRMYAGEGAES